MKVPFWIALPYYISCVIFFGMVCLSIYMLITEPSLFSLMICVWMVYAFIKHIQPSKL